MFTKTQFLLRLTALLFAANTFIFVSLAALQQAEPQRAQTLIIAKRTGYSPVVPVPAEETSDWNSFFPKGSRGVPLWLIVKPAPLVDGKPIVSHHTFHSKAMRTEIGYNVFLPPSYEKERARRYPVIYWAHGRDGNEYKDIGHAIYPHNAIVKGELEPLIIVYVNGLAQSSYLDSSDGKYMSETAIIRELIPHIDTAYRTIAACNGRGISGMSMGGFGSLHLAFKYPELFSSVVAYGAALFEPKEDRSRRHFSRMVGDDTSKLMAEHPFALARKNADALRDHVGIKIVCGAKDTGMLPMNRKLHDVLSELSIDHEYEELASYGHDIDGMYKEVGVEGLRFAVTAGHRMAGKGRKP